MAQRPTGTVTFLFTDIEGSTRLWEERPDAMGTALARHDEVLQEIVSTSGGYLVKSTGDGALAVFDRAHEAVEAATQAQAVFQEEEFGDVGRLSLRMALHTGEAEERKGDYFGPALNRTARLLSTGHGGQVLVSAATREVLGDAAVEFTDLGEHRLRDLARPEHVYQLLHPALRAEFPPLASLDADLNNLPVQLTSFVGREEELREISKLLGEMRLVTLTGVGGAGKTRLAFQAAAEQLDLFPHGTWVVELAPVSDPGLVVNQAAKPFGVQDMETDSGRLLVDVLADYLADRELLLLLDNCEHVHEASAELAEALLGRCPNLRMLATSRERLGINGETAYPVPPLGLPSDEEAELEEAEAVLLFADRASHVVPDFRLMDDNRETVRQITQRLDGLPLAIELIASRISLLTPYQMLDRLDDQLALLARGRAAGRHGTLEAAMQWSYELLDQAERSVLRQLAVFAGGWSLEAAEAVCDLPNSDVLDVLGRLVDKSLVEVSELNGVNRYRLLEPVRQYALGKLRDAHEEEPARMRHAKHYLELAEETDLGLRGPDQEEWARVMEADHDNVREALGWSLEAGEQGLALRLAAAMGWFWWLRGYWKEAQRWFHRVYDSSEDADPVLRARAVSKVAGLEIQRARPAEVTPLVEAALETFRAEGDDEGIAWTMMLLADSGRAGQAIDLATQSVERFAAIEDEWGGAYAAWTLGFAQWMSDDEPGGYAQMQQAVDTFVRLGDRWSAAWVAFVLGQLLTTAGRYREARRLITQSLELVEGTDDRWIVAHCQSRLGIVATVAGDPADARKLLERALPVHRQIGDENCTALALLYLGEININEGAHQAARADLAEALEGYRDLQNPFGIANGIRRMGWLAAAMKDHERASRLLGAADALRDEVGGFIPAHDRERMDDVTSDLRTMLGTERLEEWMTSGAALSQDEAITYALSG